MNFETKLWKAVSTQNGMSFIPESFKEEVMTSVIKGLTQIADTHTNHGTSLEDLFDDHEAILFETCKPFVLEAIEKIAPNSWFKPVFMSREAQKEMGLPV